MEFKDYYEMLRIDKNANPDEIKKAYRKLARKYHPDVNPGNEAAEKLFDEINEANDVLTDPERRAKYDRLEASWQAHLQAGDQQEFDWSQWITDPATSDSINQVSGYSEFFEAIFSGIGQAPDAPKPERDYTQAVEIALEEAFSGTSRILRIGGRRLEVRIPKGVKTGTKIRIRGEGKGGQEGEPKGDLFLEIKITPHPTFEQVGNDLYLELPVDLYTAVLGGEAIVPLLKGKIKLKIPPETHSGRTFRLKGLGMPHLKQPDQRGDLYAKVMIQVPENLSEEEIALFEELADIRGL
jgi:curved DNA-binding protein